MSTTSYYRIEAMHRRADAAEDALFDADGVVGGDAAAHFRAMARRCGVGRKNSARRSAQAIIAYARARGLLATTCGAR